MTARKVGFGPGAGRTAPAPPPADRWALASPTLQLRRPPTPVMGVLAVATILVLVIAFWTWRSGLVTGMDKPTWFAGYVDVTVSPEYNFEEASTPATKDVVLSFIVASSQDY